MIIQNKSYLAGENLSIRAGGYKSSLINECVITYFTLKVKQEANVSLAHRHGSDKAGVAIHQPADICIATSL